MAISNKEPDWPEPKQLDEKLPPVQRFDEGLLPDSIRPRIVDIAERMQVPIDYPAAALLVILGGAIGRRAAIQPKAKDTGWMEVPNLYGGIVGPPGALKSPVISAITKHVEEVDKLWHQEFRKALRKWNEENERKEKGDAADKPKRKRLVINDFGTCEK